MRFEHFLDRLHADAFPNPLVEAVSGAWKAITEAALPDTISKIVDALQAAKGIYAVGGAVRDEILGKENKDIDILVTGLSVDDIIAALKPIATRVGLEGASFSAVKAVIDGEDFDFVIPRTERSTGAGHKDFAVVGDPTLPPEKDAERRDFTMNAVMKDLRTGQLFDPTGGLKDIESKRISAVGNAVDRFSEDPLRMLRALQFASRMGFGISEETLAAIEENRELLANISGERIGEELAKAWGKSSSTEVLNGLLDATGVGEFLFGQDFKPRDISLEGLAPEVKKLYGFVSTFIDGGNPERMMPSNDQLHWLSLAKRFQGTEIPVEFIRSEKDVAIAGKLQHFFASDPETFAKIGRILTTPVLPNQLAISARQLMELGVPQKELGKTNRELLKAVWEGTENDLDSLSNLASRLTATR